jgi:hypothetical protein
LLLPIAIKGKFSESHRGRTILRRVDQKLSSCYLGRLLPGDFLHHVLREDNSW